MNSVSFGNIPSSTFTDMVNRPQAYKNPAPAASTSVASDSFGSEKPKKKVHILPMLAAGAAVAVGALVLSDKKGLLKKIPNEKIKTNLQKAAGFIEKKYDAAKEFVVNKITDLKNADKVKEAAEETAEFLS